MENEGNISEILNETGPQPDLNPEEPEVKAEEEAPEKEAEAEAKESEQKAGDKAEPEKGEKEPDAPPASAEEKQEPPKNSMADIPPDVQERILHDERRKRQEETRKRVELENRLAAIEQASNQQPVPDVIEDPEAFVAHQDQKRQQERLQDRVAISEEIVRTSVGEEEYAKAEAAFTDEMTNNPSLAAEAMRSPNPAMFMYKTGKAALERQEIGDPREYAAKQVAEALAAQKATMAEEIQKQVQEQVAKLVPKSLADDASAGARTTQQPVDDGPVPIEQILNN